MVNYACVRPLTLWYANLCKLGLRKFVYLWEQRSSILIMQNHGINSQHWQIQHHLQTSKQLFLTSKVSNPSEKQNIQSINPLNDQSINHSMDDRTNSHSILIFQPLPQLFLSLINCIIFRRLLFVLNLLKKSIPIIMFKHFLIVLQTWWRLQSYGELLNRPGLPVYNEYILLLMRYTYNHYCSEMVQVICKCHPKTHG